MREYECSACGKIISDREQYSNGYSCDECLHRGNPISSFTYQDGNNIDNILESKRGARDGKV